MEQINKLNNLILEQIIRSKIHQQLPSAQLIQEQDGPTDLLPYVKDTTKKINIAPVITDNDPEAEARKKAAAAAAEKKRLEAKKKADDDNMKAARSFSTAYKNSTGATVDFAKPVKVDGIIPSYTSSSFKVGNITYKSNGTWENTKKKLAGTFKVENFKVITNAGTSTVKTKKKTKVVIPDTKSLSDSEVNTLMRKSVQQDGKVNAALIANIIKGSTRWYGDKESRANIAFLSIKDSAHYYEVKRHLKSFPWKFIQGFMNTSKVFKDSDFSNPSYFNNTLKNQGKAYTSTGWASCDAHLKTLNLHVDPANNPESYEWGIKNPLGGRTHDTIKLGGEAAGWEIGEKTNSFIQYLILAAGAAAALTPLMILKRLFPKTWKRIWPDIKYAKKGAIELSFSRAFMRKFPGYSNGGRSMANYDKLSSFSLNFFDRQLAAVKNDCVVSINAGTMTRDEAKELVDIFADNKMLIMQHLKNGLIKDLFRQHVRRNSIDASGNIKTLWTSTERAGVMRANEDFLQIVPPVDQPAFRASLERWVNRHVPPPPPRPSRNSGGRRRNRI